MWEWDNYLKSVFFSSNIFYFIECRKQIKVKPFSYEELCGSVNCPNVLKRRLRHALMLLHLIFVRLIWIISARKSSKNVVAPWNWVSPVKTNLLGKMGRVLDNNIENVNIDIILKFIIAMFFSPKCSNLFYSILCVEKARNKSVLIAVFFKSTKLYFQRNNLWIF